MTAPLNLDALEAAARAANQGDWWHPTNDQFNDILDMERCDFNLLAAASPAAVLELIERLRTAEAREEHYRKLAGELRKQQMAALPDMTGVMVGAGDYDVEAIKKLMAQQNRMPLILVEDDDGARINHLLAIIGAFYQICAEHDFPEHLLDILSDPAAATPEQVDALLPYVLPEDEPSQPIVEPIIRTKDEWTAIALAQGHGPDWVQRMLNAQDMAKMAFDMNLFGDPMAGSERFLGLVNAPTTDDTTHLLASPANAARLKESMAQLAAMRKETAND